MATEILATRVATGLSQPVFATAPPGDTDRLFIVERTGQIKILDLATGDVSVFLDISGEITTIGEGGLLGLAFDPNYAENGQFYVDFTNTSDDTEVRRYQVFPTDPNQADPSTATPVIKVDQPDGRANHKAGWIAFGPDGYLYVALGDGGGSADPDDNAQNIASLLGKILRIDVHGDDFPGDSARNYSIPSDNPFLGTAGAQPEIFALGLRNPFRNSFDRATGEFYIADVGEAGFEEIDIGTAGGNYGWDVFEGPASFEPGPLGPGTLQTPIYSYDRTVGRAVIGGYVYRGESEALQGLYFFADEVTSKIFTLEKQGTSWVATDVTAQTLPDFGDITNPTSFGEDASGNLYIIDIGGDVFRLSANSEVPCFCRGTRIRLDRGEVPVEELAIGDKVMTRSGAAKPIKWIGRRAYAGRFVADNRMVLPVRVGAGAIADGVPSRDLWLSPEHAFYIDGALVPARQLINGATIVQAERVERVEYFHIELAAHDVIFADGTPAETFVDCDNRGMFHNATEFAALYPGDDAPAWRFCAPRVRPDGAKLARIRARLLARAERTGSLTGDPDLHLVVDGETVRANSIANRRIYAFAIPPNPRAIAIVSRNAVPAETEPMSQDRRRLGVAVERIILSGHDFCVEFGHDCPALRDGFHRSEPGHRWTDGRAVLPVQLLRRFPDTLCIELHIADSGLRYRVESPPSERGSSAGRPIIARRAAG